MKTEDFGQYLFSHYSKETRSLSEHLKKAEDEPGEKNIHQVRVVIKRMRIFFHLLEILFPKKFDPIKYYSILKPVFKAAGAVREAQVNRSCFKRYKSQPGMAAQYLAFLESGEKKYAKIFNKKLLELHPGSVHLKSVKELCGSFSKSRFTGKCRGFIKNELVETGKLLAAGDNPVIIHHIRMHLKSIVSIAGFLYKLEPSKELRNSILKLKQKAVMTGKWHDKVILVESLEKFMRKDVDIRDENLPSLVAFIKRLKMENLLFFKQLKPGLVPVLKNFEIRVA